MPSCGASTRDAVRGQASSFVLLPLRAALSVLPPLRAVPAVSLVAVLITGLLGSAHCLGMCGGFALALGALPGTRSFAVRFAAYGVGKTATYAALGALAGSVGYALWLAAPAQRLVTAVFGLAVVASGVLLWRGTSANGRLGRWMASRLTGPIGRLVGRRTFAASLGLGLVNGLLPCGLVWAMLAVAAAAGDPARGAVVMAVFGVATLPALLLAGTAGRWLVPRWRQRVQRVGALVVILIGLLTVLRVTPAGVALAHAVHVSPHWGPLAPIVGAFCAAP